MRRAARTDSNQTEIVKAFRTMGCSVHCTHMVGDGFTDLVVGFRGRNHLVEVKDGAKAPSQRKLTQDEAKFHREWRGRCDIVETINEVIALVNRWSLGV